MRSRVLLLLLAGGTALPVQGQQADGKGLVQAGWARPVPSVELLQPSARAEDSAQAGCPDCIRQPKFWRAAWQLMIAQLLPFSINHFVRDAEWADISFASWATNLENPWQWDNNKFLNNQFSHPYHGSLYFSAARVNGYNFWQSIPWAFGGSLMWEWFGEAWAPSPNDLWNTSLGGITLGETLYRLSNLTLDNQATGSERTWREIGATLINPVHGFNRLIDGRMNDINENPPDWRPTKIQALLDVGYRKTHGENSLGVTEDLDQPYVEISLFYGDQVEDLNKKPFSAFSLTASLGGNSGEASTLSNLYSRGNLASYVLKRNESSLHQLAGLMIYQYVSLPTIEFGGQGFSGGLVSRWGPQTGTRLYTELLTTFMPIAALQSDHFITEEGRDYDYGVAFGGRAEARAVFRDRAWIRFQSNYLWLPVMSGFNGDHTQATLGLEGRYVFGRRLGAGFAGTWYHRQSDYDTLDDVSRDGTQYRVFGTYAIPRLAP